MARVLAIIFAILALAAIYQCQQARAQTPYLNCADATANSTYLLANEQRDCLDAGISNGVTIAAFTSDANASITTTQLASAQVLEITSGAVVLTATRTLDFPDGVERLLIVHNGTLGGKPITLSQNAGATVRVDNGLRIAVVLDGTNVYPVSHPWMPANEEASPASGDRFPIYDASASTLKWIDYDNLPVSTIGGTEARVDSLWVEIGRTVASNVATVNFTFDPDPYIELQLLVINAVPATSAQGSRQRVSDDNGATWEADASDYEWNMWWDRFSVNPNTIHSTNGDNTSSIGGTSDTMFQTDRRGNTTGLGMAHQGVYRYYNARRTNPTYILGWNYAATATEVMDVTHFTGQFDGDANKVNGIQFFFGTGNVSSGLFVLLGLRDGAKARVRASTPDNTPVAIYSIILPSGETATFKVMAHGLKSSGETYAAEIFQVCRNSGGTTSCATQSRNEIELGTVTGSVDVSVVADDTADTGVVQVTGASSQTWSWNVGVEVIRQ